MSEDLIYFSRNLIFIRKYVNVTQAGLAEKLGTKSNTISNYEKGVSTPDFKVLVKLCKLFCLPTDMMLNTLLTAADLDSKPDWMRKVRENFNLNDVDLPPSPIELTSQNSADQLYISQLLELVKSKDETIQMLNRQIGRLELQIELLKEKGLEIDG